MKITASPGRVYVLSPPDIHERAVRAAAELILLDFTRETIEYELGQKFGMTRPQALRAVHEAFARVPLRLHHPRV